MNGSLLDQPMAICVAPNGARKTHKDHPAVPMTPQELADGAVRWREAGAAMLHLHVRDSQGGHVLDADLYVEATRAVRAAVGEDMVIQITTEAVGKYTATEQMAVVRAVRPEAVSLAVRELIPDADHEREAADFLADVIGWGGAPQYILYSPEDVERLHDLRQRGIIPGNRVNVLFVLGRYARDQESEPRDLLPFIERWDVAVNGPFSVCAFGRREGACVLAAGALGGHARVGFENNVLRADGRRADDNADLIAQAAQGAHLLGRRIASAHDIRTLMRRYDGQRSANCRCESMVFSVAKPDHRVRILKRLYDGVPIYGTNGAPVRFPVTETMAAEREAADRDRPFMRVGCSSA